MGTAPGGVSSEGVEKEVMAKFLPLSLSQASYFVLLFDSAPHSII